MRISGVAISLMILVTQAACSQSFDVDAAPLQVAIASDEKTAVALNALQGDWALSSVQTNDERGCSEASMGPNVAHKMRFRINGDLIQGIEPDQDAAAHFAIDATRQPMWMDIELADGTRREAVFAVTQDSISLVVPNGNRLTSLNPGEIKQHYVIYRLRRIERAWPSF